MNVELTLFRRCVPDGKVGVLIFFLFLHENVCCGYSSECELLVMNTHNIWFCGEIKVLCGYLSSLSVAVHLRVQSTTLKALSVLIR